MAVYHDWFFRQFRLVRRRGVWPVEESRRDLVMVLFQSCSTTGHRCQKTHLRHCLETHWCGVE